MAQGNAFTETQIRRILEFLGSTEMTLAEIAQRMGCSRGAVASINRRFGVRDYAGFRSKWSLRTDHEIELLKKQPACTARQSLHKPVPFDEHHSTDESMGNAPSKYYVARTS